MSNRHKVECVDGVIIGNQCLVFITDNGKRTDWEGAKAACSSMNGQLAILKDNPDEVHAYININLRNDAFWIGGSDTSVEGNWVWFNGQPVDQQFPWKVGEPDNVDFTGMKDGNCLVVNWHGYQDEACGRGREFICELETTCTMTTTSQDTSTWDTTLQATTTYGSEEQYTSTWSTTSQDPTTDSSEAQYTSTWATSSQDPTTDGSETQDNSICATTSQDPTTDVSETQDTSTWVSTSQAPTTDGSEAQ
ncbi:unnamed protein product, partial [Meganyctiphanes norvegica]